MRIQHLLPILFLLFFGGQVGAASKAVNNPVAAKAKGVAYFIEFTLETYAPVTPQNIKQQSDKIFLRPSELSRIEQIISQKYGAAQFDARFVRLKIETSEKHASILMVDQMGTASYKGKSLA